MNYICYDIDIPFLFNLLPSKIKIKIDHNFNNKNPEEKHTVPDCIDKVRFNYTNVHTRRKTHYV